MKLTKTFSRSIREIFSYIKRQVSNKWVDQEVHYSAISGFIFLRFFCPAILNPKLVTEKKKFYLNRIH